MTFNIENWLNLAIEKIRTSFEQRLLFIGLQGSYNRGEANSESDIDLVVILDKLTFEDLKLYKKIMKEMPDSDKACGFISGKQEIQNWSKSDLFQFIYDTKPLLGNLEEFISAPSITDIEKAVKTNSENLYHAAVHSFVHSKTYAEDLKNLYKMSFFIMQAKYFLSTNNYIKTKNELIKQLDGFDKDILEICINKDKFETINENEAEILYNKLIQWTLAIILNEKTKIH